MGTGRNTDSRQVWEPDGQRDRTPLAGRAGSGREPTDRTGNHTADRPGIRQLTGQVSDGQRVGQQTADGPGIRRPTCRTADSRRARYQTANGTGPGPGARELLAAGARTAREVAEIQGERLVKNQPSGRRSGCRSDRH